MQNTPGSTAVLLLSCPDTRGIVAEVSHFIFAYGGNILQSDQYSDPETKTFFMRVVWDLAEFKLPQEKIPGAFEAIAIEFDMNYRIEYSLRRTRMAIFVSKYDHCLYDLLLRNREGETHADIALILANHRDTESIAKYFDIPFHYFPITADTRDSVEEKQIELLRAESVDLVVLARYMQILSERFVEEFKDRIINIHHSFLPAFVGAKPYHQAYSRGVKIIGASSHYVTADLDQGPIIEQDVARISHKDSVHDLIMKGRNLEKMVLTRAVKLHLEHRILVFRNKTVVFE